MSAHLLCFLICERELCIVANDEVYPVMIFFSVSRSDRREEERADNAQNMSS